MKTHPYHRSVALSAALMVSTLTTAVKDTGDHDVIREAIKSAESESAGYLNLLKTTTVPKNECQPLVDALTTSIDGLKALDSDTSNDWSTELTRLIANLEAGRDAVSTQLKAYGNGAGKTADPASQHAES